MFSELIESCWRDPAFKKQLLASPRTVLKQEGIDVPAELTIKVHENTAEVMHLVVPAKLQSVEAQLEKMGKPLAALIRRVWDDPSFAARVCENPKGALADLIGIQAPGPTKLAIHCDTPQLRNFVIPVDPGTHELRDRNLYVAAGSIAPRRSRR
jgi:Nitrile hydratase, alpha chain